MIFNVKSHKQEYLDALKEQTIAALEAIGSQCAGYAGPLAPADTGRLRNSITWATSRSDGREYTYHDDNGNMFSDHVGDGVPDDSVYIGTNVEYATYQELGTSKVDAHPYLRPAVTDHLEKYERIAKKFLKGQG